MKKVCLFVLTVLFMSAISFATIRRVGYNGIARPGVDYTDFNSAQAASAAGDTIQVYSSVSGTVNKRLVIMGFGYNFDTNPNLQAIGGNSPSNITLSFDLGSENSIVEGCSGGVTLVTSNITIRRFFGSIAFQNQTRAANNTRIESCILTSCNMQVTTTNPTTNIQIYNCIYYSINFYMAGTSGSIINCVSPNPQYVGTSLNLNNAGFLVKNCIIGGYDAGNINTVWENNFFFTAQPAILPPGSNNRWGQVWANLFNRLGGTTDNASYYPDAQFREEYFLLKPGSAAINGGFDASNNPTDAGIFGGDAIYRYRSAGVPAVPAIYKLTAPSSGATSNPFNVTISVRSNN
jgi:hypothetical protein